jgi:hypothetical protein
MLDKAARYGKNTEQDHGETAVPEELTNDFFHSLGAEYDQSTPPTVHLAN